MTPQKAIPILKRLQEPEAWEPHITMDTFEALELALDTLEKHQADKKLFGHGYWIMPGELFISHNKLNEVLDVIIKSMDTEQRKIDSTLVKTATNDEANRTDDHIADSGKMVDQFRKATKKTDSERVSLFEQEKLNSFSEKPSEEAIHEMKCIPALIRCKNCAHSTEWYGQKRRCFLWHEEGIDVLEDGYCNYADRKKQGCSRHPYREDRLPTGR